MSAQILLVEDTPHTLELMAYLLEARGHDVVSANDGPGAVAQARAGRPDLVVMDIQLAGSFDGFETLRRIRSLPGLRELPIVAVTAFAMLGDREHALRAGFTGYLTKPIDPYIFGEEIERYLPVELRGRAPVIRANRPVGGGVAAHPAGPARDQLGVLVVDDNPTGCALVRSILEPFGFRVTDASTVGEALSAVRDARPDLVLSDLHLGAESGMELWRRLQDDAELADLPFAFLTATGALMSDLPSTVEVIRRPVEPQKLLLKVQELVGEAAMHPAGGRPSDGR